MNSKKFKIDFIGIGVEKSATYWVANCLREHPEICFANKKEVTFFNEYDQHFLKFLNPRYSWGIEWYKKHFSHCKNTSIKGEYTPTYLYSPKAAKRIKKYFPDVKLIVCLRDPTERAFSQYLHDTSTGVIRNLTFEEALEKNGAYIEKGFYYKYLKIYLKHFSKKQIHVIFSQDIKKNPKAVVKKLYKYLKLKNTNFIPESLEKRPNRASGARSSILNYILLQTEYLLIILKLGFLLRLLEDMGLRKMVFNFSYNTNRKPLKKYPKMKKATQIMLRKTFKEDIKNLEKLSKRSLSSWKRIK